MTALKRQILTISAATRSQASWTLFMVLICLLCAVSVACGSSTTAHEIVVDNLEKIRPAQTDRLLRGEFRSVEDAFKIADNLLKSGEKDESERYYRLAHVKTKLLEKHLEAEKGRINTGRLLDPSNGGTAEKVEVPQAGQVKKDKEVENPQVILPNDKLEKEEPKKKPSIPIKVTTLGATDVDKSRTPADCKTTEILVGSEINYVVKKLDTLKIVGAKTGVNWQVIAKDNGLDPKKPIQPGRILRINTRRIVPKTLTDGIVINIPDLTLYLFKEGKVHVTYPVALGMAKMGNLCSWHTPTGKFKITAKSKDPTWYVPQSIKQKMKSLGKAIQTVVPPGPANPLGKFAISTSLVGILIHSTISPQSINSYSSHGCIRMLPRDMETFFNTVHVNTSGEIIYQPVKVAVSDKGRVFLEVHADAYNLVPDLESTTKKLLEGKNAVDRVDWKKVKALLRNGNGKVEDITL